MFGTATDGTVDSDDQIVDPEFANRAMAKWFATRANVREMHQPSAVGKGVQLVAEDGAQLVKSKVVDPVAVQKVLEGIYSDYSVGIARPRIVRDRSARNGRIVDGEIVELSLVDRGANYNAHFAIAKRAKNGGVEYVGKIVGGAVEPDAVKAGSYTHSHMHMGPGGIPHKHPHTHAAGTPPHDEFHEGQPHAHAHEQEESVTDAQTTTAQEDAPPDAEKAAKCGKCGGTAFTDGKCDKCGAAMPAAKGADLSDVADDVQDIVEAAEQLASDAGDVSGGDDDGDKAAAPDAASTPAAKPPFEGAAPPFGKKPPKAKKPRGRKVANEQPSMGPPTGDGPAIPSAKKAAKQADDGYDPKPYHADPDETVICPNCGKHNDVDAAYCDQCGFKLKGADNVQQVGQAASKAAGDAPAKDPNVGGGTDRSKIPAKDFVFPEDAPDGGFPIASPGDVSDAVSSWGRYKGPKTFAQFQKRLTSIARRKGAAYVAELPQSWKDEQQAKKEAKVAAKVAKRQIRESERLLGKGAMPMLRPSTLAALPKALRRAHDSACPAYSTEVLLDAYPSIQKNGVAAAMGPMAQQALYSMLANEVQEDGGGGQHAMGVHKLAKAYYALTVFLDAEQSEPEAASLFLAARDELHGAFKQANADAMGPGGSGPTIPKPTDPPQPGQFRRPYITSGEAAMTATAEHDQTVTAPLRPVDADQFDRGPLTDGQQRSFADKMTDFHDALVALMPDLCRMDAPNPPYGTEDRSFTAPDPSGWAGITRQPAQSFQRPPSIGTIPNGAGNLPKPLAIPASAPAPGEKLGGSTQVAPSAEAVITSITQADIDAAVSKAVGPWVGKVASLQTLVDQMASQGDPAQRADRGTAVRKAVQIGPSAKEARRQAKQEQERQSVVDYWAGVARAGAPDQRTRAIRKLAKLGVDIDDLAE